MRPSKHLAHVICLLCVIAWSAQHAQQATSATPGADWPVWGGPNRDFRSPATGLLATWPANGPVKLWTRTLGEGYSAPAIEGRRLYTMYSTDTGEVVTSLDASTGKTLWEHSYRTGFTEGGRDIGNGPYAMPQVVGERLVTVGGTGRLYSLEKRTGRPVWTHDLYAEFGASRMQFGYSCHALPYKDLLIMSIGGSGKSLIEFYQADGKVVWARHCFHNSHS
jgi:outer membrane protein assembly factor BamB